MNIKKIFLLCLACTAGWGIKAEEARLLRFPNIHGDKITFSYAGDIYSVDAKGGTARRLTSHIGYEMFPRISPDGKYIAFTGQYDGNTEVFIMPVEGGDPQRLTYTATLGRDDLGDRMGPNNIVMGWTPDSKEVLFRSRQYTFNDFTGQLFTVPIDGGMPKEIPLKDGGFSSYSPDGKKLAYNNIFREFRTWKRYEGGMADNIHIFDFDTKKSETVTQDNRQDVFPMWASNGTEIYYLSDKDNDIMNLYVYDLNTKQSKMLTNYTDYDIKFPSIGKDQIVYEQGGYIYKFDTRTKTPQKVTIEIENDQVYARPEWKNVSDDISSISIAPNGERLLVTARGDIFTVPAKEGITYNLTDSSNANDNNADWSPDGKQIAYVSDKDGEFNIYVRDLATGKEKKLLGKDIKTYIFGFQWSPDSKKILWSDKRNTLNITDVATGQNTEVEKSGESTFGTFNWSPDSKYITYVRPEKEMNNIIVYSVADKKKHVITDGWYDAGSPNFSNDGKYLVFTSARTFNPTYSQTEWNHAYTNMDKVYLLPLATDAKNPFAPKNDMPSLENETKETKDSKAESKTKGKDPKENSEVTYNFENINNRIIELPVIPSYYYNLSMIDNKVYYNRGGSTYLFNLEDKKETNTDVNLLFSPNYKKALAFRGKQYEIINIPSGPVKIDKPINLSGLKKRIDYQQEWMQVYNELWRRMRDFFYAPNMHGVNWEKIRDKYAVLVPYVKHRTDLTYIVGEMIGELSVGHAYSINGEHPEPARIPMGLLGAKFSKDASGYFKVDKIIEGANWNSSTRSPLTMPEVNVKEGDYILSVNGKSLKEVDNLFSYLIDTANKTVELEVNGTPSEKGARKVLVTPLADESQLYYYNWVQNNIRKVNEATNGQVGYIHIPDMGVAGLNEFVKHYYPQLNKKALIIDDRGNGGGNVSPMIIERLLRTPAYYTMHTNQAQGAVNPVGTFLGPKVLLVDQYSASDGDLFPYRFKHYNLGTIIGKRTWGGVVGYSGMIPAVDGGTIVTPSYAPYSVDGKNFIIEGHGVEPHIDLANDPYKEYMGEDEQLNKAIEVALGKLKTEKKETPAIPAFPDKRGKN